MKVISKYLFVILLLFIPCVGYSQAGTIYDDNIHTLQVIIDRNPLLPPVMELGKHQHVEISWDEFSHEYHRYVYHIQHCGSDWAPSEEIFESDYLKGLNDQPVEDYEKSFNTLQLYTHYSIRFPNEDVALLLSGNYRVLIYEEGSSIDESVLEARFSIFEKVASIRAEVSSNTDIDFNKGNQQVTLAIGYGTLSVVDPQREITTVVMQNRRWDNRVVLQVPNIRNTAGIEFTHNRDLIFPAGSEFHKFEILDVNRTAMGVDKIEWFEPYYHATLFPEKVPNNYSYDEDQNGVYVLRSSDDVDDDITAEYIWVHFILTAPRLPGGDVYVCGEWTNEVLDPSCKMEYNELRHEYEVAIYLKQGYYGYQFRQEDSSTGHTMGDFFETENEYSTFVYYRGQGARYDRLVGYSHVNTGSN